MFFSKSLLMAPSFESPLLLRYEANTEIDRIYPVVNFKK